jgi:hypothetical protein
VQWLGCDSRHALRHSSQDSSRTRRASRACSRRPRRPASGLHGTPIPEKHAHLRPSTSCATPWRTGRRCKRACRALSPHEEALKAECSPRTAHQQRADISIWSCCPRKVRRLLTRVLTQSRPLGAGPRRGPPQCADISQGRHSRRFIPTLAYCVELSARCPGLVP